MVAVNASLGVSRITSGETDLIYVPRNGHVGRYPALLFHGQLRTATDWNDSASWPGSTRLAWTLAQCGILVMAGYWGGPLWGNDTADADVEAARTLAGTFGCATDKILVVGASMGALEGLAFAAQYPAEVAAGVCLIPAVNLDDARDNDRASAQANINTAFGLTAGSTSATVPLPATANPYADVNAAKIKAPFRFYGSSADTVAGWDNTHDFGFTVQMAAKIGASCSDVSDQGHTDATIAAAPVAEICQHLYAHSKPGDT